MIYSDALPQVPQASGSYGITGSSHLSPELKPGTSQKTIEAKEVKDLPQQAAFELMRFQMVNSAMNADIARGVKSLSSVLTLLPTIIRNIS